MKLLYVTDIHGVKWKYERILRIAEYHKVVAVINGGDMLPKDELFSQGSFIREYLDYYFARFERLGIYYLCYLGNDDLRIFQK